MKIKREKEREKVKRKIKSPKSKKNSQGRKEEEEEKEENLIRILFTKIDGRKERKKTVKDENCQKFSPKIAGD